MTKVAVIGGGTSAEREISLKSAENIYEGLRLAGINADFINLASNISKEFIKMLQKYNLVMPILHGRGGEDGTIQKLLSELDVNYLGSKPKPSAIAFNKIHTKEVLIANKINVPAGMKVSKANIDEFLSKYKKYVIKPINEGSSIDTIIERGAGRKRETINDLLNKYREMLAEELVEGVEISVSVLGDKALPPVAIFPPKNEEFNLINKYNGKTLEICPITEDILPGSIVAKAQQIAEEVHLLIGARHLSRTDMIISQDLNITVLEINTMPGMTKESLFIKSAQEVGLSIEHLASKLVLIALET